VAAGDYLVDAVSAAAITASSPPPRNSCYYTSNHSVLTATPELLLLYEPA